MMLKILAALEAYYMEYGSGRSMDYVYGYMDAIGVVRDMIDAERQNPPQKDDRLYSGKKQQGGAKMSNLIAAIIELLERTDQRMLTIIYHMLLRYNAD